MGWIIMLIVRPNLLREPIMNIVLKTTDTLDIQLAENVELMVTSKLKAIYSRIKLDARCDVRRVRNADKWWRRLLKIFLCEYGTEYDRALANRFYLVKETNYDDFVTLESIRKKLNAFFDDCHDKKDATYLLTDTESDCIIVLLIDYFCYEY